MNYFKNSLLKYLTIEINKHIVIYMFILSFRANDDFLISLSHIFKGGSPENFENMISR